MQFWVRMRDGESHTVDASYIEVVSAPDSSSYTFLGPVPGFDIAILATFPVQMVAAVLPLDQADGFQPAPESLQSAGGLGDQRPRRALPGISAADV